MTNSVLQGFLGRHHKIGLDTSVFIFQVEENPNYLELVTPIFVWLEGLKGQAVTSTVTMLELLVQPYRLADVARVDKFYALFSTYPHLEWIAPSLEIVDCAARLRAEYNLKTPDALQAATALVCQATGLISNDPVFQRVADLEIIVLDNVLAARDED